MAAPTVASIKALYSSPYEGGTKVWSSRYFFNGPNLTLTTFENLADALSGVVFPILSTESSLDEFIGYNPGSEIPAFTKPGPGTGTYALGSNPVLPLEVCALVRWATDARTSKNHPIYLFKYIHNVQSEGQTSPERLRSGIKTSWDDIATSLVAGISDGTNTRKLCSPRGAVAQSGACEEYVTHRDFPR